MAKEKDPFKDDFSVDDDYSNLDKWDSYDGDDFDLDVEQQPVSKSRKAIEVTSKAAVNTLKSTSGNVGKRLYQDITKNMPKTRAAADLATGMINEFSYAKQELLRSSGQLATQSKALIRNLLPSLNKFVPSKLQQKLEEFSKEETDHTQSEEARRDQLIKDSIGKALQLQTEQSIESAKEQRYNTLLDRKIGEKRHLTTVDILNSLKRHSEYQTEFYKTITTGYYNKSLELQYKSFFTTKDMLAVMQSMVKIMENRLAAIQENTALPDIQKQRKLESYKQVARAQLAGKINEFIGSRVRNLGKNTATAIKNRFDAAMSSATNVLSQVNMGLELSNSMSDGTGDDSNMLKDMGNSFAYDTIGSKIAEKIFKKINPNTRQLIIDSISSKPEKIFDNIEKKLITRLNRKVNETKNVYDPSFKGTLQRQGINFLADVLNLSGTGGVTYENQVTQKATDAATFDNLTRTSIVEIIPRLLAKIEKNIRSLQSGKKEEELVYDESTRDFVTESVYRSAYIERMHGTKETRRNTAIATGVATIEAGLRHHSADGIPSFGDAKKTFKEDTATFIRNHVTNLWDIDFKSIKLLAERLLNKNDTDENESFVSRFVADQKLDNYKNTAFKGIKDVDSFIKLLYHAVYNPDGKLNIVIANSLSTAVFQAMDNDNYKQDLLSLIEHGKAYLADDHFKKNKVADRNGSLRLAEDNVIKKYQEDFNEDYAKSDMYYTYEKLYIDLTRRGFSRNDALNLIPIKSIRVAIKKKYSKDERNKRYFSEKQFNHAGKVSKEEFGKDVFSSSSTTEDSDIDTDDIIRNSTNTYSPYVNTNQTQRSSSTDTDRSVRIAAYTTVKNVKDFIAPIQQISDILKEHFSWEKSDLYSAISNRSVSVATDTNTEHLDYLQKLYKNAELQLKTLKDIDNSIKNGKFGNNHGFFGKFGSTLYDASKFTVGKAANLMSAGIGANAKILSALIGGGSKIITGVVPSLATGAGHAISGLARGASQLLSTGMSTSWDATKTFGRGIAGVGKFIGRGIFGSTEKVKQGFTDLYDASSSKIIVTKKQFKEGIFTLNEKSGKFEIVTSLEDIKGTLYDKFGNVIATKDELKSAIDRHGKSLKELVQDKVIWSVDGKIRKGIGGLFNLGTSIAKKTASGIGALFGLNNKLLGLGFDAAKGIGKFGFGLIKKMFGIDDGTGSRSIKKLVVPRLDKIISLMKMSRTGNNAVFGDTDGDGIREGSYQDYVKEKEEKDKNNDVTSILDKLADKLNNDKKEKESGGGLLSTLFFLFGGKKLLGLFNNVKSLLSSGLLGLVKVLGKGLAGGVGGIFKLLFKILGVKLPATGALAALAGSIFKKRNDDDSDSGSTVRDILDNFTDDADASRQSIDRRRHTRSRSRFGIIKDAVANTGRRIGMVATRAASVAAPSAILSNSGIVSTATNTASTAASAVANTTGTIQKGFLLNGAAATTSTISSAAKSEGLFAKLINALPDRLISQTSKERIKNFIPNIFKRLSKKGGSSIFKRILARLASGPFAIAITAATIGYEGIHAMVNAKEIMGLPDDCELSVVDRGLIGAAAAIAEGIFFGTIDTPWLASVFGVDVEKIKKTSRSEQEFNKQANRLDKSKVAAGTTAGYAYSQMVQKQSAQITSQSAALDKLNKSDTGTYGSTPKLPIHDFSIKQNQNNPLAINYRPGYASAAMAAFLNEDGAGPSVAEVTASYSTLSKDFDNIKPLPVTQSSGRLGDYVKKYESGSTGAATIAWDRTGGTSYGTYQLAAKQGAVDAFMKWCETKGGELGKKVASMCKGIQWDTGSKSGPGPEAWKKLAAAGYIQELEYKYIKETQYDVALKKLPDDIRNAVSSSRALQEMLWSTVVQHGIGSLTSQRGALRIFTKCWKPGIKLDDFVRAVYADRSSRFGSSTAKVQKSVTGRFKNECALILGMLGNSATAVAGNNEEDKNLESAVAKVAQSASMGNNTSPTSNIVPNSGSTAMATQMTGATMGTSTASTSSSVSAPAPGMSVTPTSATPSFSGGASMSQAAMGTEAGATGKDGIVRPTESDVVTSPFGPRNVAKGSKNHKGIDLRARMGQPIFSMKDGVVGKVGGNYGTISVDHGDNLVSRYLHLSKFNVKPGQQVKAGDVIGYAGGRGPKGVSEYTPHLHLDIAKNGTNIDPEQFLKSAGVELKRKGEPGNNNMAPMSDVGAEPKTGNEESSTALKKDIEKASGIVGIAGGGMSPDNTQITTTTATNGTDMSTISENGVGSTTMNNLASMQDTSSTSMTSFSRSTASSDATSNGLDISSLIKILEQTNIYLSTIASNSELLKQLNNMTPVAGNTTTPGVPQHDKKVSSSQAVSGRNNNSAPISSPVLDVRQGSTKQQHAPVIM